MTDLTRYRLSLLLAIFGAMTVIAHGLDGLRTAGYGQLNLPTFEQSAPDVAEWPLHQFHQYLPIG